MAISCQTANSQLWVFKHVGYSQAQVKGLPNKDKALGLDLFIHVSTRKGGHTDLWSSLNSQHCQSVFSRFKENTPPPSQKHKINEDTEVLPLVSQVCTFTCTCTYMQTNTHRLCKHVHIKNELKREEGGYVERYGPYVIIILKHKSIKVK